MSYGTAVAYSCNTVLTLVTLAIIMMMQTLSYPKFEPPAGCDESCWGYQPCNIGFTHPSYEGWNHTKTQLPSCSRTSPTDPLHNGEGCCHTTAYMAVKDQVKVPKVQPGEYVVRWRWDCEQSPQIWSGCGDVTIE